MKTIGTSNFGQINIFSMVTYFNFYYQKIVFPWSNYWERALPWYISGIPIFNPDVN